MKAKTRHKPFLVLATLLVLSTTGRSQQQTTGFFGKRFLIEFSGSGYFPFFTMNSGYYDADLMSKKAVFDPGFKGQFSYAFSDRFMAGFEYARYAVNVVGANQFRYSPNGSGSMYYIDIKHEELYTNAADFNLKFELGSQGNIFPSGLSHQFGIGFSTMKILEKDYNYQVNNHFANITFDEDDVRKQIDEEIRNYTKNKVRGVNIFYEIHMRTPITKWLLLSYGFRVNAYFMGVTSTASRLTYYDDPVYAAMKERRTRNFASANLGLSVIF